MVEFFLSFGSAIEHTPKFELLLTTEEDFYDINIINFLYFFNLLSSTISISLNFKFNFLMSSMILIADEPPPKIYNLLFNII